MTRDDRDGLKVADQVKSEAYTRLARKGTAALPLANIAADLKVDPAEVHRHFSDPAHLLTAMILDAYQDMGDAAEYGAKQAVGHGPLSQWVATCRSIREWAMANPERYVLIWGPPQPDYSAPAETMVVGARAATILISLLRQAHDAGTLTVFDDPTMSEGMQRNVDALAEGFLAGLPPTTIARTLVAWTQLLGMVSFSVYGHVQGFAADPNAFFDHAAAAMGRFVGLTASG
ncbi:TetR/AcrR family transcriptional regulator [Solwaraspora sp. WMMB335]|uniref:TetR/AcrR family transcriptional regulator n=1 Tax=Solwaraspora sp. WMMB335 TaxID=3404118 RepID=UPI003B929BA7